MATAAEKIASDPHKNKIRKAFGLVKTHASAVANFTLQWQELEDHFTSVNDSIQSKLRQLHSQGQTLFSPAQQSQLFAALHDDFTPTLQAHSHSSKETQLEESFGGIPTKNGHELLVYLNRHLKEHESMRDGVRNAIKGSEDSGKLVLEAIEGFFCPTETKTGGLDSEVNAARRSCVLLLEEFMKLGVGPLVKPRVVEEALKLALSWKSNIKAEVRNSLEVWGFLLLLCAYGLVGRFDRDEILKLFGSVVQRKNAPELFRSLGFADKASDFIQHLILEKKQLAAARFIYAFELVDKFPLVPLLKAHLNHVKKVARLPLKKGKNTPKAQNDATNKEIASLKSVIRCIEDYKLEFEYSPENLRARIERLRKVLKERIGTQTASGSQVQVQQLSGNKRTAPKVQMNKQRRNNKQPRIAPPPAAAQCVSARAATASHSIQQHQAPLYLPEYLSSARVAVSAAAPTTSFIAAPNYYSMDVSHNQEDSPFKGHGAQYSAGSYSFSRSIPDSHMSITAGAHSLHRETIASHYTLGGSGSVASHLDSIGEQYGTSIAASGRSGQFGSAGVRTAMGISSGASPQSSLSYYHGGPLRVPSYNDRPVSYGGGYEMPSKRPPAIYRL